MGEYAAEGEGRINLGRSESEREVGKKEVTLTASAAGVSALAIVLVPFTNGALLLSVAILGGVGVGTVWTNTDTAVSNLAKEGRLAATLGAAGSFKELGDMLGP